MVTRTRGQLRDWKFLKGGSLSSCSANNEHFPLSRPSSLKLSKKSLLSEEQTHWFRFIRRNDKEIGS